MTHGTFRNKISKLMKKGEVSVMYYSPQGFFTLRGTSSVSRATKMNVHAGKNNLSKIINEQELIYFKNKPIYS
jgi:hypothetical protein